MDRSELVNLPLPMATTFLCAALAVLMWRLNFGPKQANAFFALFFGLGAVTSFLVSLRFGYKIEDLITVQRALPLFLAPSLYLGFVAMRLEGRALSNQIILHFGVPFLLAILIVLAGDSLQYFDLVITVSYLVYCVALLRLWRKGADAAKLAPIHALENLSNWQLRAAGFLAFILILDSAIALDFALTGGRNASNLISYATVPLVLLLLATLVALPRVFSRPHAPPARASALQSDQDTALLTRLEQLMTEQKLYLSSDITLQRLAKRLSEPARNVSSAVNRSEGLNMSQYVNRFRLDHAAKLLATTDESVTAIASQSGFLSRSNFYREFQRMHGQSPAKYRDDNKHQKTPSDPD